MSATSRGSHYLRSFLQHSCSTIVVSCFSSHIQKDALAPRGVKLVFGIPDRRLDLAIRLISQGQFQQLLPQLFLGGFGDGDTGAIIVLFALLAPIVLDEAAQVGQGSLADVCADGAVGSNVCQNDGKCRVRLGVLEVEFGAFPWLFLRQLGVGQQLGQLVLHVGASFSCRYSDAHSRAAGLWRGTCSRQSKAVRQSLMADVSSLELIPVAQANCSLAVR